MVQMSVMLKKSESKTIWYRFANDEIFFQYEMHQRHLATGCHLILQTSDTAKKNPARSPCGFSKVTNKDWAYKNSSGKTPVGKKKYAIFSNADFFLFSAAR